MQISQGHYGCHKDIPYGFMDVKLLISVTNKVWKKFMENQVGLIFLCLPVDTFHPWQVPQGHY